MQDAMAQLALDALCQREGAQAWALFTPGGVLLLCSAGLELRWQGAVGRAEPCTAAELEATDAGWSATLIDTLAQPGPLEAQRSQGELCWRARVLGHPPLHRVLVLLHQGEAAAPGPPTLPWAALLDQMPAFVMVLSPDGRLLHLNRAPLDAGGVQADDVIGLALWDTPWWSHDPALQQWLRDAVQRCAAGTVVREDVMLRMRFDTRMSLDFLLAPCANPLGRPRLLMATAIDVTDRKVGERLLRSTMARFRSIYQAVPQGLALLDAQGRIATVNPACCELFGWNAKELVGRCVDRLIPGVLAGPDGELCGLPDGAQARVPVRVTGQHAAGHELALELELNPVPGSEPPQTLLTLVDVGERERLQRELRQNLREKTVLLNEVHHRVKNNLQVIASLLRLQSRCVEASAQAALQSNIDRVRAMALTHQLLYESSSFSALRLGSFLSRLGALLRDSQGPLAGRVALEVRVPDAELAIALDQAVPVGLVVNELVSNAFKHGFPDERAGWIRVDAFQREQRRLVVRVADNGVGLAAHSALGEGDSLGFQLVPALSEQLGGVIRRLDRAGGPGTAFELEFEAEEAHHDSTS